MLKYLIQFITPKKKETMTKHVDSEQLQAKEKEVKKLLKALEHSNEDLKKIQKQFGFNNEHYIVQTIQANDKLLKSFE